MSPDMQKQVDQAINIATAWGTAICGGSWFVSTMGWLNDNSAAVLALCAIMTAIPTFLAGVYGLYRRIKAHQ